MGVRSRRVAEVTGLWAALRGGRGPLLVGAAVDLSAYRTVIRAIRG